MITSINCSLHLLVLSSSTPLRGLFFHGDRAADAFILQPRDTSRLRHSSKVVVVHSFSYLGGGLGEESVVDAQTATFEPVVEPIPRQPFPFASSTIPAPVAPLPQKQQEEDQTELYFDDWDTPPGPANAFPEPPVIANPYDFTPLQEDEEEEITEVIPTVVTPVPRSSTTSAITTTTSHSANHNVRSIWETDAPTVIQGGSLRTWNFNSERIEAVQVLLKTNGRPLKADIELWQGENAPQKISVYTEDGDKRPLSAFVATPYTGTTAIAVKNAANMEFPLKACVEADLQQAGSNDFAGFSSGYGNQLAKFTLQRLWDTARPKTVQGDGATYVVPFEANIQRVQILITSEKNPINARIEILEGPNNVKQVLEIATEDGKARPFFCVLELPDPILTNVLRVVNTGPLEFPIECRVEPFAMEDEIDNEYYFFDTVPSGGSSGPFLLS